MVNPNSSLSSKTEVSDVDRLLLEQEERRLRNLYAFLLSITDLGSETASALGKTQSGLSVRPNESLIAKQWGLSNYRIFVRRVLRAMYPDLYQEPGKQKEKTEGLPHLDMYRLVNILNNLGEYKKKSVQPGSSKQSKKIRDGQFTLPRAGNFHLDKLKALRLFSELSLYERELLEIPWRRGEGLLQKIFTETATPSQDLSDHSLRHVYQTFIQANQELFNFSRDEVTVDPFSRTFVQGQVQKILCQYPGFSEQADESIILKFQDKVEREINRIRLQSGLQHIDGSQLSNSRQGSQSSQTIQHIPAELIPRLIKSVIENEILTEQFPIFIQYLEVKKVSPLPLYIYREDQPDGLLNQEFDLSDMDAGIERQFSYSVKIHFYARIPREKDLESNSEEDSDRIEFYEEITGIGSPLSHVTAAVNRTLLWDIPCLDERNIFPIVKQLFLSDEIIGDSHNSPVWSHCVVQLCTKDNIRAAIQTNTSYDRIDIYAEPAHGDFCGFDMLEAIAKSALNARLRCIQQMGIDPRCYLRELGQRVQEVKALRKAKGALKFYPFSIRAMEGILEAELFQKYNYGSCLLDWDVETSPTENQKSLSRIACDARLCLAEALLTEGKYAAAKNHMDNLISIMEDLSSHISDLMRAKYYLLLAQYHYHYDIPLERPQNISHIYHEDRNHAVQAVERALTKAKDYLNNRVRTCEVLDELPQSNIHPFSILLARIHFLEARLKLTFGAYLRYDPISDCLHDVMISLQKARICAAQDGSSDDYAEYSAFQSWLYLMLAQIDSEHRTDHLDWAGRLLDHAIECYAPTGESAYHDLKNHAGVIDEEAESHFCHTENTMGCEVFGHVHVQSVPFLLETSNRQSLSELTQGEEEGSYPILRLNFHLFKEKFHSASHKKADLFGTRASLLLMVTGLRDLVVAEKSLDLEMITYKLLGAYSISKDGGHSQREDNFLVVRRNFEAFEFDLRKISIIQGLYPHRISYIVALSGIFLVICSILSIMKSYSDYYDQNTSWTDFKEQESPHFTCINFILYDMHEEKDAGQSATLKGTPHQQRFNGHLVNHFERIKSYIEDIINILEKKDTRLGKLLSPRVDQDNNSSSLVILEMRDYLLSDMTQLILGVADVSFMQSIVNGKSKN